MQDSKYPSTPKRFRVVDKERSIVSLPVDFDWFITGEPYDLEFPKDDSSLPLSDFQEYKNDFIINSSSVKNDVNGKEICEHDIIRGTLNDEAASGTVICLEKGFFVDVNGQYYELGSFNFPEVVGNIYESVDESELDEITEARKTGLVEFTNWTHSGDCPFVLNDQDDWRMEDWGKDRLRSYSTRDVVDYYYTNVLNK
jgi:hypothetical protein